MQVTFDSQPAPGQTINEDLAMAGPRFAFVLDGATEPPGLDTGCEHGVAWFVNRLGGELARLLVDEEPVGIPDSLATAITQVRKLHSITCDLGNPSSPSSTVAVLRESAGTVDYLVLADSPIVLRATDGTVTPVRDSRADRFHDASPEALRERRNVADGFWVASTAPDAAYQAVTGSVPTDTLASAGIFSDGASRLAERHGRSWDQLLGLLEAQGPSEVISEVRDADAAAEPGAHGGKVHDDATALLCRFGTVSVAV